MIKKLGKGYFLLLFCNTWWSVGNTGFHTIPLSLRSPALCAELGKYLSVSGWALSWPAHCQRADRPRLRHWTPAPAANVNTGWYLTLNDGGADKKKIMKKSMVQKSCTCLFSLMTSMYCVGISWPDIWRYFSSVLHTYCHSLRLHPSPHPLTPVLYFPGVTHPVPAPSLMTDPRSVKRRIPLYLAPNTSDIISNNNVIHCDLISGSWPMTVRESSLRMQSGSM